MFLPLVWLHISFKVLRCFAVWSIHHQFFLRHLQLCSEIFGNLLKFLENVLKCLSGLCTTFGESSEIFWKCLGNLWKVVKKWSLVSWYNKHGCFVDMEFLFSCSNLYVTRLHRSWILEEKLHIYAHPCILYLSQHTDFDYEQTIHREGALPFQKIRDASHLA